MPIAYAPVVCWRTITGSLRGDGLRYLLDTTFLIDLQRKDSDALELFESLLAEKASFIVPTIVLAEFLAKSTDPMADTSKILETAVVLQFTVEDAQVAGRLAMEFYKKGSFPGWSNVFIAGVAENRGRLPIVTRNPKHFPMSEGRTY